MRALPASPGASESVLFLRQRFWFSGHENVARGLLFWFGLG
jgi:hypothetical protein